MPHLPIRSARRLLLLGLLTLARGAAGAEDPVLEAVRAETYEGALHVELVASAPLTSLVLEAPDPFTVTLLLARTRLAFPASTQAVEHPALRQVAAREVVRADGRLARVDLRFARAVGYRVVQHGRFLSVFVEAPGVPDTVLFGGSDVADLAPDAPPPGPAPPAPAPAAPGAPAPAGAHTARRAPDVPAEAPPSAAPGSPAHRPPDGPAPASPTGPARAVSAAGAPSAPRGSPNPAPGAGAPASPGPAPSASPAGAIALPVPHLRETFPLAIPVPPLPALPEPETTGAAPAAPRREPAGPIAPARPPGPATPRPQARAGPGGPVPRVERLRATETAGTAQVTIATNGAVAIRAFTLEAPPRLVLDLEPATHHAAEAAVVLDGRLVERVRSAQFAATPVPVVRVVVDLRKLVPYRVEPRAGGVTVHLGPASPGAPSPRPGGAPGPPGARRPSR